MNHKYLSYRPYMRQPARESVLVTTTRQHGGGPDDGLRAGVFLSWFGNRNPGLLEMAHRNCYVGRMAGGPIIRIPPVVVQDLGEPIWFR